MRGSPRARLLTAAAVMLGLLSLARSAAAHTLGAECTLHGVVVRLETYFEDDSAVADARVVVRDEARDIVVEGRTDAKGTWSFPAPPPGLYRVTVDAGAGHQTTIRLRIPLPAKQTSAPASVAMHIHEGPTRKEFTRFPWGGVALGLTMIAGAGFVWWGYRRLKERLREKSASATPPT